MLTAHLSDSCGYALAKPEALLQAGEHAAGARTVPLADFCKGTRQQLSPRCRALRQDALPGGCCGWGYLQAAVDAGASREEVHQVLQLASEPSQALADLNAKTRPRKS